MLDGERIAFGDYNGNRQLLSTGNVSVTDRVSLFLMDYAARERLKIIGHASVHAPGEVREIAGKLAVPEGATLERVFVIKVAGFDWNCPKYITPRFTESEVAGVLQPMRDDITALEARLRAFGQDLGPGLE